MCPGFLDIAKLPKIAKLIKEKVLSVGPPEEFTTKVQRYWDLIETGNNVPYNEYSWDGIQRGPNRGIFKHFHYGSVYYHQKIGAHAVLGPHAVKYTSLGGPEGFLGYPVSDTAVTNSSPGYYTHFEGGSLFSKGPESVGFFAQSPHEVFEVHGAIRDRWAALGWDGGPLGFPTTDESMALDEFPSQSLWSVGRFNHFERGSIFWTPDTGAWEVMGAIRDKWIELGRERSFLGYPISGEELNPPNSKTSFFHRGQINITNDIVTVLPKSRRYFLPHINTGAPIESWVEFTMNSNGRWVYKGNFRNTSNFVGLNCEVSTYPIFRFPDDTLFAVRSGSHHVSATLAFGKDHKSFEDSGFDERIIRHWDDLESAPISTTLGTSPGFVDIIQLMHVGIPLAVLIAAGYIVVKFANGGYDDYELCPEGAHYEGTNPDTGEPQKYTTYICKKGERRPYYPYQP
ncbi:LGFP repeat-containing protein [Lysinibacillus xylanilyticus]|uniref:Uncharacterized protein n=1 Tax=Lysinibacillus xylanilyticus TaxID=582475 RepID=A0A2M9Q5Q7_9BACI|nr:hypothetical protein [Lysinibacillus xylanilyticus]PJO43394.1 hypothetical protein CWD94_12650 [Lysinibacillus xylanilyticus]